MRVLGWTLNLIASLILLWIGLRYSQDRTFFGDQVWTWKNGGFWYHFKIYIITDIVIFATGIWTLIQNTQDITSQKKITQVFEGNRTLNNDAYKIYLASKYNIHQNETFKSYQFNDQLYTKLESALQAAHGLEELKRLRTKQRATIAKDGNLLCGQCGGYNEHSETNCKFCNTELVW